MLGSRRHDILNNGVLKDALKNIPAGIDLALENKYLSKSGLRLKQVESIHMRYDKFNPTRGGSYIETLERIANEKACRTILLNDNTCVHNLLIVTYIKYAIKTTRRQII